MKMGDTIYIIFVRLIRIKLFPLLPGAMFSVKIFAGVMVCAEMSIETHLVELPD